MRDPGNDFVLESLLSVFLTFSRQLSTVKLISAHFTAAISETEIASADSIAFLVNFGCQLNSIQKLNKFELVSQTSI